MGRGPRMVAGAGSSYMLVSWSPLKTGAANQASIPMPSTKSDSDTASQIKYVATDGWGTKLLKPCINQFYKGGKIRKILMTAERKTLQREGNVCFYVFIIIVQCSERLESLSAYPLHWTEINKLHTDVRGLKSTELRHKITSCWRIDNKIFQFFWKNFVLPQS